MRTTFSGRLRRTLLSDHGQALPMVALMMVGLLAMAAFVVDMGHIYFSFQQLQASTDAAALAGAQQLPNTTAASTAASYSSVGAGSNSNPNLKNVAMVSGYPMVKCVAVWVNKGVPCLSPANGNALQVKQQASVPMFFAPIVGIRNVTITASATATSRGANPKPYNVAIVIDTTLSMNFYDANCSNTQIGCALTGVQQLLQGLSPCSASASSCSVSNGVATNSVDRVSVFTFPQVTTSTVSRDSNCGASTSTAAPYGFPTVGSSTYSPANATYQITDYLSDYRTSDTASSLNATSSLSIATGAGGSGCSGMGPPSNAGNYGTMIAGVIYAAQSTLQAQAAANPGSHNIMIVLSDGNSTADGNIEPSTGKIYNTSPIFLGSWENYMNDTVPMFATPYPSGSGSYPSWAGECGQSVTAAQYATAQGTVVYAIAYGSPSTGCVSDSDAFFKVFGAANTSSNPNITPCQTMAAIASSSQYFYSDYNQTGSGSTCVATSNSAVQLNDIFTSIHSDLTHARLIPDNET